MDSTRPTAPRWLNRTVLGSAVLFALGALLVARLRSSASLNTASE